MNTYLHELDQIGRKLRKARARQEEVMVEAQQVAVVAAHYGVQETTIARILGVNRMTVRKWRGKR